MQSTIHFLPAEHGDAFILHCYKGDNDWYIVVDGGPYCLRSSNFISKQFDSIPHIDLMVLTHHDDDHIGGILRYIKAHKDDNPFPVKKIWANYEDLELDVPKTNRCLHLIAERMQEKYGSERTIAYWIEDEKVNRYVTD